MKNIDQVESVSALCALQRKIAGNAAPKGCFVPAPLGCPEIDGVMGGGLARGRLHEVFAAELADNGSAAGFAAMLACVAGQGHTPLFWLREEAAGRQGSLHAPGLRELGIDPGRIVLVVLPDPVTLLRAAVDVVRCPSVGAAVIELWYTPRALDLTASRRLALAAETSGVTPLLLRVGAEPGPSAAQTRWRVSAFPSLELEAGAPGRPALSVELLRQRGRPDGGCWHLEWDRDRAGFDHAALSGAVVSPASSGSLAQGEWRRAG